MKKTLTIFFLTVTVYFAVHAQEFSFPSFSGFKIKTDYPVFTPENLYDFIDGAADNYLAYGFSELHVAEYKKGREVIKAEIYKHKNHILAFGIYSTERSPSFRFLNTGSQGYRTDGTINFFKGNYYVKIRTYSRKEKTLQAMESIAGKIAAMLEGETEMPSELSQFPPEGRNKNEEMYIAGNVLGHSFLNNAFRANYSSGTDNFSLYIIKSASVETNLKIINSFLTSAGSDPVYDDEGKIAVNDGYNGTIFLAWKENRIILISGLAKDQADLADRYSSAVLR